MSREHLIDRSVMFTALLEASPKFGQLDTAAGDHVIAHALLAWYDSTATDMYQFACEWITEKRKDLLPLRSK